MQVANDHMARSPRSISEGLADLQDNLYRLFSRVTDEELAAELADILQDVASMRLLVDVPVEGDRRKDLRAPRSDVSLCVVGDQEIECAIQDLSIGGAFLMTDEPLSTGTDMSLYLPEAGPVTATVVLSVPGGVHVQFLDLTELQAMAIVDSLANDYLR